ncbi:aromatic acid exporter family protein [Jeotgalibaca sp. MA1X17-3]|uniref:FUSC family protein n=1 Tax=Jeotgalibaca sp. MA1X17-3 TaxID=2908211 RepID=UPI001F38D115|nr:aromatic acid exporter family protein [Jeotgalibaca sp. MA1X17-3]UJF15217.1 aromatic acid exporter family protein [Jeotgalibaca sp. MA1X17-3]
MKLGARSFKTGLAVALSIALAQLISPNIGVIAGISAVSSTQPSVAKSYTYLKNRLIANAIGGILAAVVASYIGANVIFIGLASVLLIAILNYLNLGDAISLAVVTLVVIMMSTSDSLYFTAALRVGETFIGVIVAFLVNTFIYPPKYGERLFLTIDYTTSELLIWIRAGLRKNTQYSVMNKDLKWAQKQLSKMESFFQLLSESKSPFRKQNYDTLKILVIYRRMISCTRAAYKVLYVMHSSENVFYHFPKEMRILIRERLETLMSGHEQIMLKFRGRVPADQVKFFEANRKERQILIDLFFEHARKENDEASMHNKKGFGVVHLMSAILAYEDELIRFNKLVTTYVFNNPVKKVSNIHDVNAN